MIIAIDGPSGSGKSSTARAVSERLGALFMDTGAMYRAAALHLVGKGVSEDDDVRAADLADMELDLSVVDGKPVIRLNGRDVSSRIRDADVTRLSSVFSSRPEVRNAMVAQQRVVAARHVQSGGTVVMEGRDIGTVVFPDADLKFYMDADARIRAQRRAAELRGRGERVSEDALLEEMLVRDRRDSERAHSPLRRADDALVLDTSNLSFEDQVEFILEQVRGNEAV
ncbi:MAG: (d)CMP kinase [Rhodothermales bacterium]